MKSPFSRPSKKHTGSALPVRMRFMKSGVTIIQLTAFERAKVALGFNIKVTTNLQMQHNPGVVNVQSGYELTEQTGFKPGDALAPLTSQPQVISAPEQQPQQEKK